MKSKTEMKAGLSVSASHFVSPILLVTLIGVVGPGQAQASGLLSLNSSKAASMPAPGPTKKPGKGGKDGGDTQSGSARKEGGGGSVGSGNDGLILSDEAVLECDHCPEKPNGPGISFKAAEKIFASAQTQLLSTLIGEWKLVLVTEHPEAPPLMGNLIPTGEHPEGVRNGDGSFAFGLTFNLQSSEWEQVERTGVSTQNMGSKGHGQGPHEVSIRGRGACFAHYAYNAYGGLLKEFWTSYECRLVDRFRMMCAITPQGEWEQQYSQWPGQAMTYLGYKKVK